MVSLPISLKSAHPCRHFKSCSFLLFLPQIPRIPPSLTHHLITLSSLLLLHDIFCLFFHQRGKKNTCLLAASSSPASPNLSLPRYWLAEAAAVLVLAVSSRWGRAVPLNQCPVVKEVSARKCSTRSCSRQHWQLSMRLSMGMAWPSDGWDQQWKTNKCKQTICRVHTHTFTYMLVCEHFTLTNFYPKTLSKKVLRNSIPSCDVTRFPSVGTNVPYISTYFHRATQLVPAQNWFKCRSSG